jgi:hypothetical protein
MSISRDKTSRSRWLLRKCFEAAAYFLAIDAITSYQLFDPYFLAQTDIDAPLPDFFPVMLNNRITPRIIRIAVLGFQHYAIFTLTYTLQAIICVSLGGLGFLDDWWGGI